MANKYYIPQRTRNPVVTGADMLLKFSEMKNREGQLDVARERTTLLRRRNEAEYGVSGGEPSAPGAVGGVSPPQEGLASRRVGAAERLNEIRTQDAARQKRLDPIQDQNFGMDLVTMTEGPIIAAGMEKGLAPILDSMKLLAADEKFTKGKVYHHYKANWPKYQKDIVESLNKEANKPGVSAAQRDKMIDLMKIIQDDKDGDIIDQLMPQTSAAIEDEKAGRTQPKLYDTTEGLQPYDEARGLHKPVRGMQFTQTLPDGSTVTFGPVGAGGGTGAGDVSKSVQSKLQTGIIEANDSIDRLGAALESYQPEFNTFPFRAGVKWEKFKQILGMEKDPAAHKQMVAFNSWYKSAMRDYGIAIQQLGKGNLTKNEEQIYGAGLPNPGSELIPKDPPEVYFEAVKQRVGGLRAISARYNYYLKSGFVESEAEYQKLVDNDMVYSVKEMYDLMDAKGAELEKLYERSGVSKSEGEANVSEGLTKLFGVRF